MRPHKSLKIDLNNEYPCPCRRRGNLLPIILTEAFGCDRCQQIFVLDEKSQVIEQLSSSYPYKRAWRWTGYNWIPANPRFVQGYLPAILGVICALLIVWLLLVLRSALSNASLLPMGTGMIFWLVMAVLLLLFPVMIFWLAYRR